MDHEGHEVSLRQWVLCILRLPLCTFAALAVKVLKVTHYRSAYIDAGAINTVRRPRAANKIVLDF